jgi:hypothetical protein
VGPGHDRRQRLDPRLGLPLPERPDQRQDAHTRVPDGSQTPDNVVRPHAFSVTR